MMNRTLLFGLACVLACAVLAGFLVLVFLGPVPERADEEASLAPAYKQEIERLDRELGSKPYSLTPGADSDDYKWRLSVYRKDGKTPRVYKELLKERYYGDDSGRIYLGFPIRYRYFREDGTLETSTRIEPMSQYGASCKSIVVREYYSDDGKTLVTSEYLRESGRTAAIFEKKQGYELWHHYRPDGSLAHAQKTDKDSYLYVHFRKDGNTTWWIYRYEYGKRESGNCTVFFDWNGQARKMSFKRRSLIPGNGRSMSAGDPPAPDHEDTYVDENGKALYRQTWNTVHIEGHGFVDVLARLEIFAADGVSVERVLVYEPRQFADKPVLTSDVYTGTQALAPAIPDYMRHGFNAELYDWKREHADDI